MPKLSLLVLGKRLRNSNTQTVSVQPTAARAKRVFLQAILCLSSICRNAWRTWRRSTRSTRSCVLLASVRKPVELCILTIVRIQSRSSLALTKRRALVSCSIPRFRVFVQSGARCSAELYRCDPAGHYVSLPSLAWFLMSAVSRSWVSARVLPATRSRRRTTSSRRSSRATPISPTLKPSRCLT